MLSRGVAVLVALGSVASAVPEGLQAEMLEKLPMWMAHEASKVGVVCGVCSCCGVSVVAVSVSVSVSESNQNLNLISLTFAGASRAMQLFPAKASRAHQGQAEVCSTPH